MTRRNALPVILRITAGLVQVRERSFDVLGPVPAGRSAPAPAPSTLTCSALPIGGDGVLCGNSADGAFPANRHLAARISISTT